MTITQLHAIFPTGSPAPTLVPQVAAPPPHIVLPQLPQGFRPAITFRAAWALSLASVWILPLGRLITAPTKGGGYKGIPLAVTAVDLN